MKAEIAKAVKLLKAGRLVAFPTETVYGLGADASNAEAVARLYAVKRRPAEHPVIMHFATAERAFSWTREVPESAHTLAARFWPGPLTLILKRSALARDFVTGGQDNVGVRVPSHPVAQELLAAFGSAIAAPSANRFGHVSPTTAAHVHADLGADVELVLEGGPSEVGIESTIVDLSHGVARLLRPGSISAGELEAAMGAPVGEPAGDAPRHSGGLERHYAPRTPAKLVPTHELDREIARLRDKVAVLAFSRPDERVDYWLRMPRDPLAYAHKLYAALRELDGAECQALLIEAPPQTPEWTAVRDRLRRACG
ncbi:MAG: L-threonylcarbamoyladenylate synthase [Burkholderiales bacterium]